MEDDEHMNEDFLYVVKKSLIIEEWKKRKVTVERKERVNLNKKDEDKEDDTDLLAASFKRHLQLHTNSGGGGLASPRMAS